MSKPEPLRSAFTRLARSRLAARALFGGRFPPLGQGEHYFDVTTLALRRVARERIPTGARVLDVGTGSVAVLAAWLVRRGCSVSCTEIDPAIAGRAKETAALGGIELVIECASFFPRARGEYDFVLFNPPYVATQTGELRRLPQSLRTQWDGGPDGTQAIRGFLDAFAEHGGAATALLGVNADHVARERVEGLVAQHTAVVLAEVVPHPWLPALVYVLVNRKSPMASVSSPVE